ncbi:MAG: hypothetical protein M3433_01195 [Actinomycetota bacterium]|nr:hypothetical protein [Actinomycetota bacterium]
MGESLVGAYLRYVVGCEFVAYGTQTDKQGEIDVVGFTLSPPRVWLCEVATHLDGLLYGNGNADTARKVRQKMERAIDFAERLFPEHERLYEWWSPKVSPTLGASLDELSTELQTAGTRLSFVVNDDYAARVHELASAASANTKATGEPFYRALRILTHLGGERRLRL